MFFNTISFIIQHRKKLMLGGLLASGMYFAWRNRTEQSKCNEVRLSCRDKEQHHIRIEKLCRETASKILPELKKVIVKVFSSSELVESLRNKTAVNKVAVWKQIQVLSYTKLITFIHATSILFTFLQIQLNLFGGYQLRDLDDGSTRLVDGVWDQYLGLSSHFVKYGIHDLCTFIKGKVSAVLENKSLDQKMSFNDVSNLLYGINLSILTDPESPCKKLDRYLLPDVYKGETFKTKFKILDQIILDTKDLIENSSIAAETETCMMEGYQFIIEEVKGFYRDVENSINKPQSQNGNSKALTTTQQLCLEKDPKITIPMAKIVPFIDSFIQKGDNDKSLKWIERLKSAFNMSIMGANVFETFSSEW